MEAVIALIAAAAQLEPTIAAAVPIVEKLIAGQTVSSQESLTLWTAIVKLEDMAAAKAAQIEAQPAA